MNTSEILSRCIAQEESDDGIILFHTQEGILMYDNNKDGNVFYRYGSFCRDKDIKPLIIIGNAAKERGVTADKILAVLRNAFGDRFEDAVCTMNGLFIVSNEEEFFDAFNNIETYQNDQIREMYSWDDLEEKVGVMLFHHNVCVVNEHLISETANEIADEFASADTCYWRGIAQTVIHEVRHLMLDTNKCLTEMDDDSTEDSVEEFCRYAYDMLPAELR